MLILWMLCNVESPQIGIIEGGGEVRGLRVAWSYRPERTSLCRALHRSLSLKLTRAGNQLGHGLSRMHVSHSIAQFLNRPHSKHCRNRLKRKRQIKHVRMLADLVIAVVARRALPLPFNGDKVCVAPGPPSCCVLLHFVFSLFIINLAWRSLTPLVHTATSPNRTSRRPSVTRPAPV